MSSTTDKGQLRNNDGFKRVVGKRTFNKDRTTTTEGINTKKPFQKREYKERKQENTKNLDQQQKELDQSKPFCKVCKDSGKSEEEYTNHFVRESASIDSAVVCPTLLAQACRYCRKEGHTVKYCSALSSKFSSDSSTSTKKFYNKKLIDSTRQSMAVSRHTKTKAKNDSFSKNNNSDVNLTTKEIMSSNPFGALHDEDNDADADEDDEDTLISHFSSNVGSIVAKKQWDELHSGKTLNYGDLKVKCIDGKLVFEVVKDKQINHSQLEEKEQVSLNDTSKPTWAQVASSK